MRKLRSFFCVLFVLCGLNLAGITQAVACTSTQLEVNNACVDQKFTVTTTNMAANTTFKFVLSAAGTFYVDWGDGSTVDTITRNNTTPTEYSHTYTTAGVKTIKFAGLATEYNTTTYNNEKDSSGAAIRFAAVTADISTNTGGTPALITELGGSIGSVFPTLGNSSNQIPIFFDLCQECTALTTISSNLFSGVTGAKTNMFRGVFDKCSNLATLPATLFSDISGSAPNMFRSAFYQCSSLTTLPAGLFDGINGAQNAMFKYTFAGTTGLTGYIPATLFDGLHNGTATDLMTNIFANGCGLATTCPSGTQQVTTGYEADWSGKVACAPTNPVTCQGATYLVDNTCVNCPGGFNYDTTNGKTSINQCQKHCNAGTWTNSYTQLEYLENETGSYIDTNYLVPTSNLDSLKVMVKVSIPVDAATLNNKDTGNFAGNIDTISGHSVNYKKGTFGLWVAKGTSGSKIETAAQSFPADTTREVVGEFAKSGNKTNRTITVTGTNITMGANKNTKTGTLNDPYTSTNTYKLFNNGCAGGCGDKAFVGRIHYFKLYVNNALIFDMIPVRRNSDGVLGMYDIVTGTFFTNVGTGSFVTSNNDTGITFGGGTCENVGYGYYSSASTINYGGVAAREACPNGGITYVENATSISDCRVAGDVPCSAGTYLPANETTCAACPANSYCGGGVFTPDTTDQGIGNCVTEIANGWVSETGSTAKTDCYYLITLAKNGFSGTVSAGAGTGCSVVSTATGTSQAKLKLFYNTVCTLPGINLLQSGYDTATSWATTNTITGTAVTTIPATTTTPTVKTYYARKTCATNHYSTGTACAACGSNSTTYPANASTTCTCDTGYTADGSIAGSTTSTTGCSVINNILSELHVGNKTYDLLAQKRTTPSINVGLNNSVFYTSLVQAEIPGELGVTYENKTYSACDIDGDYCIVNGNLYWADPDLYLTSGQSQYINTGVVPDLNTAIEIEMADRSSLTYSLFGVKTGTLATTDTGFGIFLTNDNFGFFRNGTSMVAIPKDNNYHVYYLSNTEASVDGVSYNFSPATEPISGQYPMYMFGTNHKGSANDKPISVKYLKIWSGNTLTHHFVPVPSGLVIGNYTVPSNGMFDIVTQTFYGNGGIGNFTYGKLGS